jgi:hypothetical protein
VRATYIPSNEPHGVPTIVVNFMCARAGKKNTVVRTARKTSTRESRYSAAFLTVGDFADGSAPSRFFLAVQRDSAFERLSR